MVTNCTPINRDDKLYSIRLGDKGYSNYVLINCDNKKLYTNRSR